MSNKKSKYLKQSTLQLTILPLVQWICKILSENRELSTTELFQEIRNRYGNYSEFKEDFPANLNKKTLLRYLNTLKIHNIISNRTTLKNVEYWFLEPSIMNRLENILPEIDEIRINRRRLESEDWGYTNAGITFYELPMDHMDKELQGEFSILVNELKDWRKRFFSVNTRVLKKWKSKIISALFELELAPLDRQLACLYCHLTNKDHKLREKWFKKDKYHSVYVVADVELARVLIKYFYPDKTEGQICDKLAKHRISEDAARIMREYYEIHYTYPYSIPSTVVIRTPERMFDEFAYRLLILKYKKEELIFKIDHKVKINNITKFFNDHIKGYYNGEFKDKCENEPDAIQLFGEFIKPYYSELESKIIEKI